MDTNSGKEVKFDELPINEQNNILRQHYFNNKKSIEVLSKQNEELRNNVQALTSELQNVKLQLSQTPRNDDDEDMPNEEDNLDYPPLEKSSKNKRKNAELNNVKEPKLQKTATVNQNEEEAPNKTTTDVKPPAIVAYAENLKKLRSDINDCLKNSNTTLFMKQDNVKIQNMTKLDFVETKKLLTAQGLKFYSFTPKDEKPFTLLIKNITNHYTEEEIKYEIESKLPEINVLNVKNFNNRMWIVQLKDAQSATQLKQLRGLLGFRIVVTKFKGNKLLQCCNCQRYNHLAANCNMDYRCVKCGEGHGPAKCKIPKREENNEKFIIDQPDGTKTTRIGHQLKCANCNQDHAASYAKCPVRLRILEEKEQQYKPANNMKATRIPTNFRNKAVSYSQIISNNSNNAASFNLNNEVQQIFGKNLNNCLAKINQFIPNYNSIKNIDDKKAALFNLMFEICLN